MRFSSRSFSGLLLCLLLLLPLTPPVHAVESLDVCRDFITDKLSTVHDTYRSVLFGSREDEDGKFIANTGGEVDAARKGIFETRYRETSELIWALVESYRVLRCQNLYVCEVMQKSFDNALDDAFEIDLLGCEGEVLTPYDECTFVDENLLPDVGVLTKKCQQLVEDTLAMEQAILRLAVAYDSGYRASLQFVGMTDWMMKDFPERAFVPLRGMVNMLGKLYSIPCFMGQCDMPDNSDIQLP